MPETFDQQLLRLRDLTEYRRGERIEQADQDAIAELLRRWEIVSAALVRSRAQWMGSVNRQQCGEAFMLVPPYDTEEQRQAFQKLLSAGWTVSLSPPSS